MSWVENKMMENFLLNYLLNYGYIIIFIGTFAEGEIVLIIAGFLANQGELSLLLVILAGALGAFSTDQFFFMLGRLRGRKIVQKYEFIHKQAKKINKLLEKYDVSFIIVFRFIYGTRIASPIIIGMSNIPAKKFIILDAIICFLWALLIASLGYLFGATLTIILGKLKHIQLEIIIGLIILGVIFWIIRFLKIRHELNKKAQIKANV